MPGTSLSATSDRRQIFSVGSENYTVRDLLDAAYFRGELQPVWEELLRLVACEGRAAEEDLEADDAAVDSAAQAFRYDHDLITAEETERWLAERGLTLHDFSDYFVRHYWGDALGEEMKTEPADYFSASAELQELLVAELIFSGELSRIAAGFAARLAVARESGTAVGAESLEAQRGEFIERIGIEEDELADWLAGLGRSEAWLDEMLQAETAYAAARDAILTPQARQREIGSLRLQLTAFEVEVIELDTRDAACEALLCVRNDGMTMEEVAAEGRYPFHREQLLLEDIGPDLQQQFLSVTPGTVIEPLELDGGFRLCRVVGKHEPDPEDAAVRDRVELRLTDRHFSEIVSKHVRWELSPV